jgi:iron complex outermembrane receptor protein
MIAASLVVSPGVMAGSLEVKVVDEKGAGLPGAAVTIPGTHLEATTDAEGVARFPSVPDGEHDVAARLTGFSGARREVVVAGSEARVTITLGATLHFTESVTVAPGRSDTFDSFQPTDVLGAENLQQRLAGSLGDTLGAQPGVSVRSLGPGPARPVIRGLDGDRVLVVEDGARTGDLSSQSGDHGVAVDPATATQIEVVRGPATLLYGSNALGGVVNLVSEEIPRRPRTGATGAAVLQGATANEEAGAAGHVGFGDGAWALRVGGAARRSGDFETPEGAVANSRTSHRGGGGAVSRTGADGYLGASYQYATTEYGLPAVGEEAVELNPRRHRLDVRGERRNLPGLLSGLKLEAAFRDYRHEEIEVETGEVGTAFRNRTAEGKLLLNHRPVGRLKGTLGLWGHHRRYRSVGEEALAPATRQGNLAAFFYEEVAFRHVVLQLGGRYDRTRFDTDEAAGGERPPVRDRSFHTFSGSLGVVGHLGHDLTVAASLARAARSPSLEELYNHGLHPGNFAFEIGDAGLETEVGHGLDVSLRYRSRRVSAEATWFVNRIDRFIFPRQTGEVEEEAGLPVVEFVAADAGLRGFEARLDLGLGEGLWLELGADSVRGELRGNGPPLPRMPPRRARVGLRFETQRWHVQGEVRAGARQGRVYGVETPTAGYALLAAHASYRLGRGRAAHLLTLRLDNAGDRRYRNHLSYIKDAVPEMGRSLKLVYSVRF